MHSQFIIAKQTHGYGAVAYERGTRRSRVKKTERKNRNSADWEPFEKVQWMVFMCVCILCSAARTSKVTWVIHSFVHSFILLRRFYVIYLRCMNVHIIRPNYKAHTHAHCHMDTTARKGFERVSFEYNEVRKKNSTPSVVKYISLYRWTVIFLVIQVKPIWSHCLSFMHFSLQSNVYDTICLLEWHSHTHTFQD